MDLTIFQQLGVATALGALIGLERERKHHIEHYVDAYAGIRTFALTALSGSLAYILSTYSMIFFAVVSAGVILLLIMGYVMGVKKHGGLGMTSEIASVLVYMIGILCGMQLFMEATVVSLLVLAFLLLKAPLHNWAKNISYEEFVSALEFLIVAFVVLPLLPNQSYGPYDFFNPYSIWLLVVFISGISFVSYIAIRLLGTRRGLVLTGFLSGFISTTALAFTLSAQSKKNIKVVCPYVLAMIVASSAMFLRVFIEVLVLNADLLKMLSVPIFSMLFVGIVTGLYFWRRTLTVCEGRVEGDVSVNLESPFRLAPALKFAMFFVLILLLSGFAVHNFGDKGIYLTSFFSGFIDVDAITVSMANLAKVDLSAEVAVRAIMITVIVNTFVKAVIFFIFGSRKVAMVTGLVFVLMAIAGSLSLFFV